ncbi:hypothetical protein V6N13_058444 [Hibiscus sabdariffa]
MDSVTRKINSRPNQTALEKGSRETDDIQFHSHKGRHNAYLHFARTVPVKLVGDGKLYKGFKCPDHFVVGYGMDFAELYRNLPYLHWCVEARTLQAILTLPILVDIFQVVG